MGKSFNIIAGLGLFLLMVGLAVSVQTMNISILGLDFTTMNTNTLNLFRFGFLAIGFAGLFGGGMS